MNTQQLMFTMQQNWAVYMGVTIAVVLLLYILGSIACLRSSRRKNFDVGIFAFIPIIGPIGMWIKSLVRGIKMTKEILRSRQPKVEKKKKGKDEEDNPDGYIEL